MPRRTSRASTGRRSTSRPRRSRYVLTRVRDTETSSGTLAPGREKRARLIAFSRLGCARSSRGVTRTLRVALITRTRGRAKAARTLAFAWSRVMPPTSIRPTVTSEGTRTCRGGTGVVVVGGAVVVVVGGSVVVVDPVVDVVVVPVSTPPADAATAKAAASPTRAQADSRPAAA